MTEIWRDCLRKAVYISKAKKREMLVFEDMVEAILDFEQIGLYPMIFTGSYVRSGDPIDIPLELIEGWQTYEWSDDVRSIIDMVDKESEAGRDPNMCLYISVLDHTKNISYERRLFFIMDIARKFSVPVEAIEVSGILKVGTLNDFTVNMEVFVLDGSTEEDFNDFFRLLLMENPIIHSLSWSQKKIPPPEGGRFPSSIDPKQDG